MSEQKPGDWTCSLCGTHNFANRERCWKRECNGRHRSLLRKAGDWSCSVCHMLNFATRKRCWKAGCSGTRSGRGAVAQSHPTIVQHKPGDWTCNLCNTLNFASRTQCWKHGCGGVRSGRGAVPQQSHSTSIQRKSGDWTCNLCSTNNFASRTQCWKHGCSGTNGAEGMQQKNDEDCDEDFTVCCICMDAPRNASFVHNGSAHTICCLTCARAWFQQKGDCPKCRQAIESVVQSFT